MAQGSLMGKSTFKNCIARSMFDYGLNSITQIEYFRKGNANEM